MHDGRILRSSAIEAAPGVTGSRFVFASYMPGQSPWAWVPDGAVVDGVVVVEGAGVVVPVSGAVAVAVDGVVVALEPVVAA
jgi:hypothetical protein